MNRIVLLALLCLAAVQAGRHNHHRGRHRFHRGHHHHHHHHHHGHHYGRYHNRPGPSCATAKCAAYPRATCSLSYGRIQFKDQFGDVVDCNECPRIRKAWSSLTNREKRLFTNGMKQLRAQGKHRVFSAAHYLGMNRVYAHAESPFLPWHRYFLWELETQIRRLGKEYKCFAVPYWDWTEDNIRPGKSEIFTDGFIGGNGVGENLCVASGEFTTAKGYTVDFIAPIRKVMPTKPPPCDAGYASCPAGQKCCLRRKFNPVESWNIPTPARLVRIATLSNYLDFRAGLEHKAHDKGHMFVGGHMMEFISPEDPLFFLHHSFTDYQWAMWQDCHDYGHIPKEKLSDAHYQDSGVTSCNPRKTGIDDPMWFSPLSEAPWAKIYRKTYTPRSQWDLREWNVKYQKAPVHTSKKFKESCSNNAVEHPGFVERPVDLLSPMDLIKRGRPEDQGKAIIAMVSHTVRKEADHLRLPLHATGVAEEAMECQAIRKHKEPLPKQIETCGGAPRQSGPDNFFITLEELLNKKGVRDSERLKEVRRRGYTYYAQRNLLRELCNGKYDPIC